MRETTWLRALLTATTIIGTIVLCITALAAVLVFTLEYLGGPGIVGLIILAAIVGTTVIIRFDNGSW